MWRSLTFSTLARRVTFPLSAPFKEAVSVEDPVLSKGESLSAARPRRELRACSQGLLRVLPKTLDFSFPCHACGRGGNSCPSGRSWSLLESPSPSWFLSDLWNTPQKARTAGTRRTPMGGRHRIRSC